MNKLIIIGNGFDLAHGLKTKYSDFIIWYLNKIITLSGIRIEIIGDWIWLSGNTYLYRKTLKETGFLFAAKKVMWFYRPPEYKSANRPPGHRDYQE